MLWLVEIISGRDCFRPKRKPSEVGKVRRYFWENKKKKEVTDPQPLEKICAPARRNQFGEEPFYGLMKPV